MSNKRKNKQNFLKNDLKVDTSYINKIIDKKKFLKYIDGNIDALNLLSVDRLTELKKYYERNIEKNNKVIKQLESDN